MQRFFDEVGAAELVHNFGDADEEANCGFDITLALAPDLDEFENQWLLQTSGEVPVDPVQNVFSEWSETVIFGFPPMANVSAPDGPTAADRPIYAAANMYRGSGGNPQCGGISAVFSRAYLGPSSLLVTPLDTGLFEGSCDQGAGTVGTFGGVACLMCTAWPEPRPLGVPGSLNHLLEPYLRFYNASAAGPAGQEGYANLNLARLLTRLLSRKTYQQPGLPGGGGRGGAGAGAAKGSASAAAPAADDNGGDGGGALALSFFENTLGYFETNPAAHIPLASGGIKLIVGMFELLFGTAQGDDLRAWCQKNGWPLAWAFNPTMSAFRCGPAGDYPGCTFPSSLYEGMDLANARLLDPFVLIAGAGVPVARNLTVASDAVAAFDAAWAATNASAYAADAPELAAAWASLAGAPGVWGDLGVEPPFFGSCASEACAGVLVASQACVCPPW
jgi:hypothetical protein